MLKIMFQAALLAALWQGTAVAQDKLPDVAVSYADLDLSNPADVQTLDHRLSRAIKAACPDGHGIRDAARLQEVSQCRTSKREEAAGLRATALANASSQKSEVASVH